jgi:hypothetical protein
MQPSSKLKAVIHLKAIPHRISWQILKLYKLRHNKR